jgi:hypothetical protein
VKPGMPADRYPTQEFLERLRRAQRCRHTPISFVPIKWVEDIGAKVSNVSDVARYQRHAMNIGGGGNQRINSRYRPLCGQAAPLVGDRLIDRQNSFWERAYDGIEPLLEHAGQRQVPRPHALNALADFTKHQNTEIDLPIID